VSAAPPVPAPATTWDGKLPFTCSTQGVKIGGVVSNLPSSIAVDARDNCELELDGANIEAKVGIRASGNAHVTIIGGSIHGATNALSAEDNGTIDVKGATIVGPTRTTANGQIHGLPAHGPHRP